MVVLMLMLFAGAIIEVDVRSDPLVGTNTGVPTASNLVIPSLTAGSWEQSDSDVEAMDMTITATVDVTTTVKTMTIATGSKRNQIINIKFGN